MLVGWGRGVGLRGLSCRGLATRSMRFLWMTLRETWRLKTGLGALASKGPSMARRF